MRPPAVPRAQRGDDVPRLAMWSLAEGGVQLDPFSYRCAHLDTGYEHAACFGVWPQAALEHRHHYPHDLSKALAVLPHRLRASQS